MEAIKKRFSFLTKQEVANTEAEYVGGEFDKKVILVSQKGPQWILTVNEEYLTVAVGDPGPIIDTLTKIENREQVIPNQMAMVLRQFLR